MGKSQLTLLQKEKLISIYKHLNNYDQTRLSSHKEGISISISAVKKIVLRYWKRGHFCRVSVSGRPRETRRKEDHMPKRLALEDRRQGLSQIAQSFPNQTGKPVSRFTVARRLKQVGLGRHPAVIRPILSGQKIGRRLQFATPHLQRTVHFWQRVKFSDERNVFI